MGLAEPTIVDRTAAAAHAAAGVGVVHELGLTAARTSHRTTPLDLVPLLRC